MKRLLGPSNLTYGGPPGSVINWQDPDGQSGPGSVFDDTGTYHREARNVRVADLSIDLQNSDD